MQPHQERVVQEKQDLDEKIVKLGEFTAGKMFPSLAQDEQQRLISQYRIMKEYSSVLGERIASFPPPQESVIPQ